MLQALRGVLIPAAIAGRPLRAVLLLLALAAIPEGMADVDARGSTLALIADAGSTGTRVYLFRLDASGSSEDEAPKVQITDLGKGPALSSFQDKPQEAAMAVQPQLEKAKELIPEALRASVPVSVFATAGMRLVAEDAQQAIYRGLREGLLNGPETFVFDAERLQAHTISGREEGVFALVAANYLARHLGASLHSASGDLMGVLDLGGSSTQVAVPPSLNAGEPLVPKLGREHTFVRSFLKLGMERMRQRTYQRFVDAASESLRKGRAVPNPCSFYGYSEADDVWRGIGDAASCEEAIAATLEEEKASCSADASAAPAAECFGAAPVPLPKAPAATASRFFLISGYLYVTDFARWFLDLPGTKKEALQVPQAPGAFSTPTISELREAAVALCAEPWESLSASASDPNSRHRFTGAKKIPHRCFELNYIAALLSVGYGFNVNERLFRIVEDVDGGEIEWTLGAFLHGIAPGGGAAAEEL
mmetsp:Transcript_31567/g.71153  ORF Transcript_31567/g.71153 Transcript_31567/m.71153 type:complete len:478 (+) Transcript_31567:70-1503(+)